MERNVGTVDKIAAAVIFVVLGLGALLIYHAAGSGSTADAAPAPGEQQVGPGSSTSLEAAQASVTDPASDPAVQSTHGAQPGAGATTDRGPEAITEAQARALAVDRERVERLLAAKPVTFRIASFNVLGDSHTAPGGNRKGWASGRKRMDWAVQKLNAAGPSVVGFQEFQPPQYDEFTKLVGSTWATYPGMTMGGGPVQNSLAWRTDTWDVVEAHTVLIPYFRGAMTPMPYVLLKHRGTGRTVWFINVHNPANSAGPAQHHRDRATSIEANLAGQLHASGTPVVLTGDLNDRERAFCSIAPVTPMVAADGGSTAAGCVPPVQPWIDWIFGTSDLTFSNYVRQGAGVNGSVSDHPLVYADAAG